MPHLLPRWTIGRTRSSKLLALAVATTTLAACGGGSDSPTGPTSTSSEPVGSYTLSTVNGKALPTSIFSEGTYSWDVTSGTIKLTSDSKVLVIMNARQTLPGSVENFVDSLGGSWSQSGASLQMTFEDGTTGTATADKNTLTGSITYVGVAVTVVYGNKK